MKTPARNLQRSNLHKCVHLVLNVCPWNRGRRTSVDLGIQDYERLFRQLTRNNSLRIALKMLKAVFFSGKLLALGQTPEWTGPFRIKCVRGFPSCLWRIRHLLESSSPSLKKIALTILTSYQVRDSEPLPVFDSVLGPLPAHVDIAPSEELKDGLRKVLRKARNYKLPRVSPDKDPLALPLLRKGPYGEIALRATPEDALHLMYFPQTLDAVSRLLSLRGVPRPLFYAHILTHARTFRGRRKPPLPADIEPELQRLCPEALRSYKASRAFNDSLKERDEFVPKLGRMLFIVKSGGGSRVVTPINYYVQAALHPYHDVLMAILRSLPTDATFREEDAVKRLVEVTKRGDTVVCEDCSTFTDLLPVEYMVEPYNHVFGKEVGDLVRTLFRIPISMPLHPRKERKWIEKRWKTVVTRRPENRRYSVGAPMGIYGIWPAAALMHHAVVQAAASAAAIVSKSTFFMSYYIRGDDIFKHMRKLSAMNRLKGEYNRLGSKAGFKFSSTKRLDCSNSTSSFGEFCKHYALNGYDLTPITIKRIKALQKAPTPDVLDVVDKCCRWFRTPDFVGGVPAAWSNLRRFLGYRRFAKQKLAKTLSAWIQQPRFSDKRERYSYTLPQILEIGAGPRLASQSKLIQDREASSSQRWFSRTDFDGRWGPGTSYHAKHGARGGNFVPYIQSRAVWKTNVSSFLQQKINKAIASVIATYPTGPIAKLTKQREWRYELAILRESYWKESNFIDWTPADRVGLFLLNELSKPDFVHDLREKAGRYSRTLHWARSLTAYRDTLVGVTRTRERFNMTADSVSKGWEQLCAFLRIKPGTEPPEQILERLNRQSKWPIRIDNDTRKGKRGQPVTPGFRRGSFATQGFRPLPCPQANWLAHPLISSLSMAP